MISNCLLWGTTAALWALLWVYTNDWDRAEKAAFWAAIGLT